MSIFIPTDRGTDQPFRIGLHKFGFGGMINGIGLGVNFVTTSNLGSTILYCSHFTFPFRCIVRDFNIAVNNPATGTDTRLRFAAYEVNSSGLPTTMISNSLNTITLTSSQQFGCFSFNLPTSGQFTIDRARRVIIGFSVPLSGYTGGDHVGISQVYPEYPSQTNTDYDVPITGFHFGNFLTSITGITTGSVSKRNSTAGGNLRICNLNYGFGVEQF